MELEYDDQGNRLLRGHLAKANPHGKYVLENPGATAVFLSDFNHYISSSWYNYAEAPTWNYMSVHVSGPVRILDDRETADSVRDLTKRHEKDIGGDLDFDKLPSGVLKQLRYVTGIEMKVEKTEAVFKLSQNQDTINFDRIVQKLKATGSPKSVKMADAMMKLRDLFYNG